MTDKDLSNDSRGSLYSLADTEALSGHFEQQRASEQETPSQAALRAKVFARIKMSPHTYADLSNLATEAKSKKEARRMLRIAVNRLIEMGLVRFNQINYKEYLTVRDWAPSNRMLARLGTTHTQQGPGGCLLYKGYTHPTKGPMLYSGKALGRQPKALRKIVFNDANPQAPLLDNEIAKPSCGCAACLEETHLVRQVKRSHTKGRKRTTATRAKIAEKKQTAGKLNWDLVNTIRERKESVAAMAKRYNVVESTIYSVLAQTTWKPEIQPQVTESRAR